ncbi:hypothetical protein [Novosphingobium sp. FSW06-99]|uniref:hypothetical protein n=1 Tax=Novosphingobium sp. FSW06-99 TaxID=1739113 RepID=UPI00076DADBA|nr:hypothetical protein [Novosphingobium sp. FSW06-99]KUR80741.1 hypothetical protein AQZ49_01555 [Novosphingobium sp. FSW06-99]
MRRLVTLLALALAWITSPGALAQSVTKVADTACSTSTTTCTASITASVPAGSFLIVVISTQTNPSSKPVLADNATTTNCSGAYPTNAFPYVYAYTAVAVCASTSGAMTSGTTCGSGGTTQCAITLTDTGSYYWTMQAYVVSGVTGYDKAGVQVTGTTFTNGSPTSFATSPTLGYTSEWALGIIALGTGATSDSMASYTGGYASIGSRVGATNRPEFFLAAQTLTSGTATLGATPTITTKNFNSVVLLFPTTGASRLGCVGLLLGAGC